MKISYRTHRILKFLINTNEPLQLYDSDVQSFTEIKEGEEYNLLTDKFLSLFKENRIDFMKNITYVSSQFEAASLNCTENLLNLLNDIIKNGEQYKLNNTFIVGNNVYMVKSVFNNNYIEPKLHLLDPSNEVVFFIFNKDGVPLAFLEFKKTDINTRYSWMSNELCKILNIENEENIITFVICNHIYKCILFDMFKKYAEVETKMLYGGKKVKDINCKYINETKLDILHLDSKWFTNLVKSEGFDVRGHFRLQPCGKELKDRKLVWINQFHKNGYTAPARMFSQS